MFDGKLETVGLSTTEMGKEHFLTLLQHCVEEHGQETFYYFTNVHNTVVNLFDKVHCFSLDIVVTEFFNQIDPTNQNHDAFDSYKKDELMLLQLVIASYLLTAFFENILVCYGHCPDFKSLSGACLLVMALETCNASASLDVDEATAALAALSLDSFPGENITDMMNKALCLIKVMRTTFMIPNNARLRLLHKLTKTYCEVFNRKIFDLLDLVKNTEHKYKMLTQAKLLQNPDYQKFSPIGLISTLHEVYGRLLADSEWPALSSKFPQSNNVSTPNRLPNSASCSFSPSSWHKMLTT
jgi:hypothetical protein